MWRSIGLYDYEISDDGIVRDSITLETLTVYTLKIGYCVVAIDKRLYYVHRLLAEAFIPNPDNKPCVDHIDRVRHNNTVSNLRWATRSENQYNRTYFGTSGIRGVSWNKAREKWVAYYNRNGKRIQVGYFLTKEEAAEAREAAIETEALTAWLK